MDANNICIKNTRIIDPENSIDDIGCIFIGDGKIEKITIGDCINEDCVNMPIIDGSGLVAAPGLVDIHVHFRDPGQTHKEDIVTGSMAAMKGGFTSVIMMANTLPAIDSQEVLEEVLKKAGEQVINVYAAAAVTKSLKGENLCEYKVLSDNGAKGFTDDGIPIMDADMLMEAMVQISQLDMPISLHEEDPSLIENSGVNAGSVAEELGLKGATREAEYKLIERDIEIAKKTGVKLNIQHISTQEGVELVRNARKTHINIHAEATPHHFTLTESAVLKHGTLAKMNPPVRLEQDRRAIIEGLKDGTIEYIATDHAPHATEEKEREFTKAPSGIIGLETSLALGITELVKKDYLTMSELIEKMSCNPAKLYQLNAGSLSVGTPGDIVLFDPDEEWVVGDFASKSCNSPFTGMTLTGKVKYTICGGKVVYTDK